MIDIINKEKCCGCGSCVQKCPKKCIILRPDDEGFIYPQVNHNECINCAACEKVCPELNIKSTSRPLAVYGAINPIDSVRLRSSSGAVFSSIANAILERGGVVFGARFDDNWQVVIDYADTVKGVEYFCGSKYVQAVVGESFVHCEEFLKQGRQVLFSATPCIIAGLLKYLRKQYNNLLTIDLACHGVPSPYVWSDYLDEMVSSHSRSISSNPKSSIKDIRFRDKANGWKKFRFVLEQNETFGQDGKSFVFSSIHHLNPFFRAFNSGVILRPSCYECEIKNSCRSGADITLADFWGIDTIDSSMDDDKGTSLILANTAKGNDVIKDINLIKKNYSYNIVLQLNSGLKVGSYKHPKRRFFFRHYRKGSKVIKLLEKSVKPTIFMLLSMYYHAILRRLKRISSFRK